MRLVGKELAQGQDVYSALKTIKGLDTDNSNARVEKILTKAGCYRYKLVANGKLEKNYPLVSELSKEQAKRLEDMLDLPCAILRRVKLSPRKARLVADLIRGKGVDEAIDILRFTANRPADVILKLLKSAIANAEHNHDLKVDGREFRLIVRKILVDGGSYWKRFHARARGRGARILKPTAHIKIVLGEIPLSQKKSSPVKKEGAVKNSGVVKKSKGAKANKSEAKVAGNKE